MKRFLIILCLIASDLAAAGTLQRSPIRDTALVSFDIALTDTLTDEYLDTVQIKKSKWINDYSMIGVHYGMGLSQMMWNPTRKQDMVFVPYNIGVTYTRYGKMFGYMPYFGFQAGLVYGSEGYLFEYDKEKKKYSSNIEGAEKALIEVVEMPLMAHMHIDFWKMKIMANIGCYGGYRLSIQRFQLLEPDRYTKQMKEAFEKYQHSFTETDRRWDYGIKGGVGLGLVLDPIEFHLMAYYKHSFSSLYQPDHASKYYYRFAYPANFIITAGIHFQLTKRTGKTKAQLKKLAKEMVYGNTEN